MVIAKSFLLFSHDCAIFFKRYYSFAVFNLQKCTFLNFYLDISTKICYKVISLTNNLYISMSIVNFVGDSMAAFSLVFMAGLAIGAWLGYTNKKDVDEINK